MIDADDLDALIAAAEDLADIEAAKAARAEVSDGEDNDSVGAGQSRPRAGHDVPG